MRVEGVYMLDQVDIDNPVIVQPQSFAKSVLRDFETSIEISFQWSSEVEVKKESQVALT